MLRRARAVIIKDGRLLLIKRVKPEEVYWVFPGGGLLPEEGPEDGLAREVLEETGFVIKPVKKIWQRVFNFPGEQDRQHEETYFECEIMNGELGTGQGPEYQSGNGYVGTHEPVWVSIADLENLIVRPEEMKQKLIDLFKK